MLTFHLKIYQFEMFNAVKQDSPVSTETRIPEPNKIFCPDWVTHQQELYQELRPDLHKVLLLLYSLFWCLCCLILQSALWSSIFIIWLKPKGRITVLKNNKYDQRLRCCCYFQCSFTYYITLTHYYVLL